MVSLEAERETYMVGFTWDFSFLLHEKWNTHSPPDRYRRWVSHEAILTIELLFYLFQGNFCEVFPSGSAIRTSRDLFVFFCFHIESDHEVGLGHFSNADQNYATGQKCHCASKQIFLCAFKFLGGPERFTKQFAQMKIIDPFYL